MSNDIISWNPSNIFLYISAEISAIHYFLHVHSLLFAQHFITFHQPKSNQLNCELLLFLEKFEWMFVRKKVSRMFTHGLKQSDRLIINNTKGCSDRYLRRQIADRLNIKMAIAEVWVYEKGRKRLFFKDGIFYKNNREDNPPCDATYRSTR